MVEKGRFIRAQPSVKLKKLFKTDRIVLSLSISLVNIDGIVSYGLVVRKLKAKKKRLVEIILQEIIVIALL